MNYRFLGLIAGLAVTAGIVSCSATPTSQATSATQSTPATKPADAMKSDAMKDKTSVETNTKASTKSRTGSFVSAEHTTIGKASIVQENETYFIELDEGFKTSENGPDLFVILHRSPNILKISQPPDYAIAESDYTIIAPLKSFNGKQRYEIPKNVQPDSYKSVAIWCRKFNATFGFAPLS
ncbi:DM13 domain-containing protein [Tumidithrix helvetica PCC 7403]|uniref:DM13 domain-containing protein n=1 Tax=Tumidithrix helvetica TaxID=3457545 RepID=UPI003CA5DE58